MVVNDGDPILLIIGPAISCRTDDAFGETGGKGIYKPLSYLLQDNSKAISFVNNGSGG